MELPHRKQNRLKDYNYSQTGAYFITICTDNRKNILGKINDGKIELNSIGEIVDDCINKISELHKGIVIPCKIVMPNHIHFIIHIETVGVAYYATLDQNRITKSKQTIPKLIQQFKAATVKLYRSSDIWLHNMQPLQWQRGYYDHIIRDEQALFKNM